MLMSGDNCINCMYWQGNPEGPEGNCHRRAPLPHHHSQSAFWPITVGSDWCGEHQRAGLAMAPAVQSLRRKAK